MNNNNNNVIIIIIIIIIIISISGNYRCSDFAEKPKLYP